MPVEVWQWRCASGGVPVEVCLWRCASGGTCASELRAGELQLEMQISPRPCYFSGHDVRSFVVHIFV